MPVRMTELDVAHEIGVRRLRMLRATQTRAVVGAEPRHREREHGARLLEHAFEARRVLDLAEFERRRRHADRQPQPPRARLEAVDDERPAVDALRGNVDRRDGAERRRLREHDRHVDAAAAGLQASAIRDEALDLGRERGLRERERRGHVGLLRGREHEFADVLGVAHRAVEAAGDPEARDGEGEAIAFERDLLRRLPHRTGGGHGHDDLRRRVALGRFDSKGDEERARARGDLAHEHRGHRHRWRRRRRRLRERDGEREKRQHGRNGTRSGQAMRTAGPSTARRSATRATQGGRDARGPPDTDERLDQRRTAGLSRSLLPSVARPGRCRAKRGGGAPTDSAVVVRATTAGGRDARGPHHRRGARFARRAVSWT